MKIFELNENIHVLDENINVFKIIKEIVNSGTQENAFYVCEIAKIVNQYRLFKQAMPRVTPHYAVKCNDTLPVLKALTALGSAFDCASQSEMEKILSLGVEPSKIIYANPTKAASHIRYARDNGVNTMTFDNESELYKISKLFSNAKLVIRIKCDAEHANIKFGDKFGCDVLTEAPQLLQTAKALNLDVIGVSFHVGTGCEDPSAYRRAISASRIVFDCAARVGYKMSLLDIGGGYPGDRPIDATALTVNQALKDFFPDHAIKVIAEPGRYIATSCYTLACSVISVRKTVKRDGNVTSAMYYINDGIYSSFDCVKSEHKNVQPILLQKSKNNKKIPSILWGHTCDSLDKVSEAIELPELSVDDWMVFKDMGAYSVPLATGFNGFPAPKIHVVADKAVWMMLKDRQPYANDQFVFGNTLNVLRLGLDDLRNNNDMENKADKYFSSKRCNNHYYRGDDEDNLSNNNYVKSFNEKYSTYC